MDLSGGSSKIVFVGETATGKTSIVSRYLTDTFSSNMTPTIGATFLHITVQCENRDVHVAMWDTAGQEVYHNLAPMYFRDAKAGVIVFDVSRRPSFEKVQKWLAELRNAVPDVIVVVCGNKIDLEGERVVGEEEIKEFAKSVGCLSTETSAKTGEGVKELVQMVVKAVVHVQTREDLAPRRGVDLGQKEDEGSGCC
jgi:small GTP-binding protein